MEHITRRLIWRLNTGGWRFPPLQSAVPRGLLLRAKQDGGGSSTTSTSTSTGSFLRGLERGFAQKPRPAGFSSYLIGPNWVSCPLPTKWQRRGGGAPTVPTTHENSSSATSWGCYEGQWRCQLLVPARIQTRCNCLPHREGMWRGHIFPTLRQSGDIGTGGKY